MTELHTQMVETDHRLTGEMNTAKGKLDASTLLLDMHRYAWTKHPDTPESLRLTQASYAELVGVQRNAIGHSVDAIQRDVNTNVISLDDISTPSEQGLSDDAPAQEVTDEQVEGHRSARVQSRHGEERALTIEALAEVFDATIGTVGAQNQQHWIARIAECESDARGFASEAGRENVWKRDAEKAARRIKAAQDEADQLVARVKEAMKRHRVGLNTTVTNANVKELIRKAHALAERNDLTLEEAITDRLEWDRRICQESAEEAERASERSAIVLDLEDGLLGMVSSGSKAHDAMQRAGGSLDLTDDEIASFGGLVGRIKGLLGVIDLLITGEVDWDQALNELSAELSAD